MNKSVFGRKLSRDKNERAALFKNLMSSLILSERIETTQAKAKAIKPQVERLVTKALRGGNASLQIIHSNLTQIAATKLIKDIAPRFSKRQGGYTRIIRVGNRLGDESPTVILEWVEKAKAVAVVEPKSPKAPAKVVSKKSAVKKTAKKPVIKKSVRKAKKAK
jgi:large subunit ribosomal protein L17